MFYQSTQKGNSVKPKVLITGGAGFIGSNFVDLLVRQGFSVTVLDAFTYAGHPENLAHLKGEIEIVRGDIADEKLVASLFESQKFQWVVNFAAESHVDRSISGPAPFVHTNVNGVFNLLNCSRKHFENLNSELKKNFRYLQISTDEVYGELGDTGFFTEESPYRPNSPYSASKASGDMFTRAWFKTYGLPTLITNCSNNYGPRQFPEKLIPFMIHNALGGKPMGIYGRGQNVRDWIHVEDHCHGILLALRSGQTGNTYCFGGRAEKNNVEVVEQICALLDEMRPRPNGGSYREQITFVQDRPGHDHRYAIDDTRAETKLGFKRKYDFKEGLRQTVKWYLENENWVHSVLRRGDS